MWGYLNKWYFYPHGCSSWIIYVAWIRMEIASRFHAWLLKCFHNVKRKGKSVGENSILQHCAELDEDTQLPTPMQKHTPHLVEFKISQVSVSHWKCISGKSLARIMVFGRLYVRGRSWFSPQTTFWINLLAQKKKRKRKRKETCSISGWKHWAVLFVSFDKDSNPYQSSHSMNS